MKNGDRVKYFIDGQNGFGTVIGMLDIWPELVHVLRENLEDQNLRISFWLDINADHVELA